MPIALFPAISLTDQLPGQTETAAVTLSDPQNGSLTNLAGGRYDDTTGVYTVSGTPAAVTAALQGLVFVPTVHPPQAGNATTTSILVSMIDTAGMTAAVTAAMVTATAAGGPASSAAVAAAYGAMLQSAPTRTAAATIAAQIDSGMTTTSGWEASLLASPVALESVLPSLVVIDAFYGVTPSSAVLAAVTATVQGWGTLGMTAADQWSVLGLQFAHNDSFGAAYGALDNSAFAGQIYQAVFGTAPPAAIQAVLAANVTALAAAYHGYDPVHSDMLGGKGALYAALLYYAETTQQGRYFSAANAFLMNEANTAFAAGTAPDYAQGIELRQRFPDGMAAAPAAMTVSNSTIDPGVGDHAMAFVSRDVRDIVVLHLGGVDDIAGFDVTAGDALAVGSLLAEAQVSVQDFAQLASYVSVSTQGADAVVSFQAPGGTASPVAVLQGLGGAIGSFDDLVRMNVLRL